MDDEQPQAYAELAPAALSNASAEINCVRQLEAICGSDDISFGTLAETIQSIPPEAARQSDFLHRACANKNVTIEIVRLLLDFCPAAAAAENSAAANPLHLACSNDCCPQSIIKILLDAHPSAAGHWCSLGKAKLYLPGPYWLIRPIVEYSATTPEGTLVYTNVAWNGLPLHYYVLRRSNVELKCVQMLVEACPDSLSISNESQSERKFTPLQTVLFNPSVGSFGGIVQYLVENDASAVRLRAGGGIFPLHAACLNEGMTATIVQLLLQHWPESTHQRGGNGGEDDLLPLFYLIENKAHEGDAAVEILKLLIESNPESVRETDSMGCHPILPACHARKSFDFCKVLIDSFPQSARITDPEAGDLPFHWACTAGLLDTAKYLHSIYPEAINTAPNTAALGLPLIHRVPANIIDYLLALDPEIASAYASRDHWAVARLPLHTASDCMERGVHLERVERLYDVYPEAILASDSAGNLPLDLVDESLRWIQARIHENPDDILDGYRKSDLAKLRAIKAYLQAQLSYALESIDHQALATPDGAGRFPIHRALVENASLGSIKLLVRGNPTGLVVSDANNNSTLHYACHGGKLDIIAFLSDELLASGNSAALRVSNNLGRLPLHIACESSTVDAVQYLLMLDDSGLEQYDSSENSALHHACRGGNMAVINCLLERYPSHVSTRNVEGKLPIHILLESGEGEIDSVSPAFVEIAWRLLLAHPGAVM